ncbi:MAG: hypothetical protein QM731_21440 [Chitinophagaceae bacterium]
MIQEKISCLQTQQICCIISFLTLVDRIKCATATQPMFASNQSLLIMGLNFNTNGNLHKDIELDIEELSEHFATNPGRKRKLDNALLFFGIFHSCGCEQVYIGGSFVSTKIHPSDIDLCFDLTKVDYERLYKDFPDFFDFNKLGEIKKEYRLPYSLF